MDIPYGASYIAKLAYATAGVQMPEPWSSLIQSKIDSCHFEYPGSTHAIRTRVDGWSDRDKHNSIQMQIDGKGVFVKMDVYGLGTLAC